MKTSCPIATISYNSPAFLCCKLEELRKAKVISEWFAMCHSPEDDEKKHHIHVYITPAKRVQTDDFIEEFKEVDIKNPSKKPLTCVPFRSSKFPDWYLYSMHDITYLQAKGQTRKYHYSRDDFLVCDIDIFREEEKTVKQTKFSSQELIMSYAMQHRNFNEVLRMGLIPPEKFIAYRAYYEALVDAYVTARNGNPGHETVHIYVDRQTGEEVGHVLPAEKTDRVDVVQMFQHDIYEFYKLVDRCPRYLVKCLEEEEDKEFQENTEED